jgi:ABC-2 type transport system permease protein/oleandomycin transport system permease protein
VSVEVSTAAEYRPPFGYAVSDIAAVTRRNLLRYVRVPSLLVFSTIQPVMFVLLFAYVFGGAISVPGIKYIDFLMPGIFVQTALFGSTQTGVGLADDLSKGIIDRFRSLPMARSAVLAGRTISDSVRNLMVVLLMTAVGTAIGFRFHAGVLPAIVALLLVVLFGHTFSWISAIIGMSIRDVESVQTASFIWLFPLTFASSVFVPIQSMPGWLQAFAKINPVSITANAVRDLTLGRPTSTDLLEALAWAAVLLLVFAPLAVARYRRTN